MTGHEKPSFLPWSGMKCAPRASALAVSEKTRGGDVAAQPKWIDEKAGCEEQATKARAALAASCARTAFVEKRYDTEPLVAGAARREQAAAPRAFFVPRSLAAACAQSGFELLARDHPLANSTEPRDLYNQVTPDHQDNDGFPIAE